MSMNSKYGIDSMKEIEPNKSENKGSISKLKFNKLDITERGSEFP